MVDKKRLEDKQGENAFQLQWSQQRAGNVSLEIYDEKGAMVMQQALGNIPTGPASWSLEMAANLPNGLYMARLSSETGFYPAFLVLQR